MDLSVTIAAITSLNNDDRISVVQTIIRSLSVDDQVRVVQAVQDNLVASAAADGMLTEEQERELERRIADDDANPDDSIPWEIIKAEAKGRASR
jgi:putative addiction module component (TIGR02574 family)